MAFFAELKRRRVFRVALVYAGVAWAVAQVADVLEPVLNLPEWTVPMVLFLLILGFPIAMVFAWAFDIGPSGIETTPSISHIGPVRIAIYVVLLLVATIGIVALVNPGTFFGGADSDVSLASGDPDHPAIRAPYDSIAVLPFENMSDDPSNEHIGSGIAEELRNSLSRVPDLKVAARTSSLILRDAGDDVKTIGEKLSVSTIIQGTVRSAGDDLRITVQLIDTESGFQLWSEAYDRKMTDLIVVQREMAEQILTTIRVEMPEIMLNRITSTLTNDLEAYDYYLRGRALWRQRSLADSAVPVLKEAISLYTKAIDEDPNFAKAYGAVAEAWMALSHLPDQDYSTAVASAEAAASRAMDLNPDLGRSYHALGMIRFARHDWIGAEQMVREGIERSPGNVDLSIALGSLLQFVGRLEEARVELERAAQLDPMSRLLGEAQGTLYLDMGRYEVAQEKLSHLAGQGSNEYILAATYWRLGDEVAAEESFRRAAAAIGRSALIAGFLAARNDPGKIPEFVAKLEQDQPVPSDFTWLLELGAWDAAFDVARKLIEKPDVVWLWSIWDDTFSKFRAHPRFGAFAQRAGFVDYWRAESIADKCRWVEDGFDCSEEE